MSVQEERHYLDVLGDELSLAVGRAVWAFARIEWLTYEYMRQLSDDRLDELMTDQDFGVRIGIIRRLIARSRASEEDKASALEWLREARRLQERRNTIAHNPWQIWIDLDREDFMTEIQRYTNRELKLDLTGVQEFTAKAQEVAAGLRTALSSLVI